MGAKSNITKKLSASTDFPVLMQNTYGSVVLFDSPTSGVCVYAGKGSLLSFGQFARNRNIQDWAPFYGSLTLENE